MITNLFDHLNIGTVRQALPNSVYPDRTYQNLQSFIFQRKKAQRLTKCQAIFSLKKKKKKKRMSAIVVTEILMVKRKE